MYHFSSMVSRTQSFTKLVRHLDKPRRLILLSQPDSQYLARSAKTLTIQKLKKLGRQLLKRMEAFTNSRKPLQVLGSSLAQLGSDLGGALAKWGPHLFIGTHGTIWNLGGFLTNQEYSKTSYPILCTTLCTRTYKRFLELSRKSWTLPMPSTIVQRCVDISRHFQNLPHSSHQWLSVDGSRSLQKLPSSYISPWGGSFGASCDNGVRLPSSTISTTPHLVG